MRWRVAAVWAALGWTGCTDTIEPREYGQASVEVMGAAPESTWIVFQDAKGKMLAQGAPSKAGALSGAMEAGGMITWIERRDPFVLTTVAGVQPGETVRFGPVGLGAENITATFDRFAGAAYYTVENGCLLVSATSGSDNVLPAFDYCLEGGTTDVVAFALDAAFARVAHARAENVAPGARVELGAWNTDFTEYELQLSNAPGNVEVTHALLKKRAFASADGPVTRQPPGFGTSSRYQVLAKSSEKHGRSVRFTAPLDPAVTTVDLGGRLLPEITSDVAISTNVADRQTLAWTSGDLSATDLLVIDLELDSPRLAWTIVAPGSTQLAFVLPLLPSDVPVAELSAEGATVQYLETPAQDFESWKRAATFPAFTAVLQDSDELRTSY